MRKESLNYIKTLIATDQYEEALELLLSVDVAEFDGEYYYNAGECFFKKRDISNALRSFDRAVRKDRENVRYLMGLFKAYEAFQEEEKAIDTAYQILRIKEGEGYVHGILNILKEKISPN